MKRWKWPVAWLVQIAEMLAFGALIALSDLLGGWIYGILSWAGMSLIGLISACRTTRRGLNNYLAWIAPPVCMALTHYLIWTYPPHPGPILLCAFVSLVGAAAGEVLNQRENQR